MIGDTKPFIFMYDLHLFLYVLSLVSRRMQTNFPTALKTVGKLFLVGFVSYITRKVRHNDPYNLS
jgi:hypothetical protein